MVVCLLAGRAVTAQTTATGTIEGRVFNPANGEYIERAHVTADGTGLESFTDSSGQYRLTNVPAGPVRVKIFYTGLDGQTDTVTVHGRRHGAARFQSQYGRETARSRQERRRETGFFVVATSKEMDGAAIAINEQRFAPNVVNVVSADEFGSVVEGQHR